MGYLLGNGMYKTIDAGKTWTPSQIARLFYNDLVMLDSNHWMLVGNDGVFLESLDGSQSWLYRHISTHHLRAITFINDSIGIIVGGGNCNHPSDTGVVLTPTSDFFDMEIVNGSKEWELKYLMLLEN
ncbi:MAG: photosystem II stability/assembly factor-like uncharacterized protein [Salibacteraceae bacterium]